VDLPPRRVSEAFNLVYEWRLSEASARQKYAILTGESGNFETGAAGGACSFSVSRFLMEHATDCVTLRGRTFMPHTLARHLWTQRPDYVYVFQRHEPDRILMPPPK